MNLFVAPTSPAVITAAAKVSNDYRENPIGFIASENQVSQNGYTGFTNKTLRKYCASIFSRPVQISRDHSSCLQESLNQDAATLDGIHIDPFKNHSADVFAATRDAILYCDKINPNLFYEVGTEEGVNPYNSFYLESFLNYLALNLPTKIFEKIRYVVIQSGTNLHNGTNISSIDYSMLTAMNNVCRNYGKTAKIHNADYVPNQILTKKVKLCGGNLAVNIAPEFASVESSTIWDHSDRQAQNEIFNLIVGNSQLDRWFSKDFEVYNNKRLVAANLMHYLYQKEEFIKIRSRAKAEDAIQENLMDWLETKIRAVKP